MQEDSSEMICSLSISSIGESSIASTCCIPAELLTQQCRHRQHQAEALQLHRESASHTLLVAAGQSVPQEVPGPLAQQNANWGHCKQQDIVDTCDIMHIQQHCSV